MGSVSDRTKSVMFKPVPGGWAYRAPNPWVFGDTPHYLVNEAQKAQIEAIIVPRRPVLFAAALVAGIIAWVVAVATIIWAFGSGHDDPSAGDLVAMTVLIVFPVLAAVPFAAWIQTRRLQPILAGLPFTDERITFADMRQRAETASTLKQSLIACIASVFACFAAIGAALLHLVVKHSGFDGTVILWTVSAIFWGYVAVVWYRITLRKAGEMQQGGAASAQQNPVAPARFVRLSQIALLASSLAVIGVAGFILQRELSGHSGPAAPDYAMARVQYEKAAAAGNAAAMNSLGWLYQSGLGVSQDYARAREWYEKAATADNSAAMNGLGWLYQNGLGVSQDYAKAKEWFEEAAATGNSPAMNNLGSIHLNGWGVPRDYSKAREWFEKAAATGNSAAVSNVGSLYQNGWGVPQDYAKAKEWFEKAALEGNSAAMSNLGSLYQFGWGVPRDYTKAKEWFEKSVALGNSAAMSSLGWLYQNGWGVPQNYAKAREWHEKAAAMGLGFSMDALGVLYVNGWGVAQNDAKAREWFEKAAAAGNTDGMQHLASMLDASKGGSADPARAAHLLLQSAKLGHKWSVTVLDGPLTFLTPATRIELKREFARLGHYSGTIDDVWDETARAAATAYLDASH